MDSEAIAKTQKSLEKMVKEFDRVINDRVAAIRQLITELNRVCNQNQEMAAVREDIQRVKIAISLANRDILQKQQVSQELKSEIAEIQLKNAELDEEIKVYENRFSKQEEELTSLTVQSEELDRMIEDKHAIIESLDNEIEQARIAKIVNAD